jgi:hypothetical protein
MKRIFIKIATGLTLLAFVSLLFSEDKVSFRTNLFTDNSGTAVQSPAVEFAKEIVRNAILSIRYTLDRVVVPPIRGVSATPSPTDAVTGASRPVSGDEPASESFTKERNEFIAGLSLPGIGLSYYYSNESDYLGQLATIRSDFDFNRMNSNLALRYSYGWDRIEPLGADTLYRKTSHNLNATLTQVLSPLMIGRVGVDLSYVDGFQSNPYRSVFAGNQNLLEVHPRTRLRGALFVKLNRYFKTRTSLHAEYRFYRDDWDVHSHTLNFFYHQYFSDNVLIRYRYRYYLQSQAYFYRSSYSTVEPYMTSDYKLEAFNAHLFGLKIEYKLEDLVEDGFLSILSNATFEAKYERYFSNRDFIADIYQIGLVVNY